MQLIIMKLLIINKNCWMGWAWQYYDQIFNNCMHMNYTTFMAVIAKYGMLRNMKEASQFLAFFSRFSIIIKKEEEGWNKCQNEA